MLGQAPKPPPKICYFITLNSTLSEVPWNKWVIALGLEN